MKLAQLKRKLTSLMAARSVIEKEVKSLEGNSKNHAVMNELGDSIFYINVEIDKTSSEINLVRAA